MDTAIDTYQRIEELVADDIDHWLCNLYFEVVLLPRYREKLTVFILDSSRSCNVSGLKGEIHCKAMLVVFIIEELYHKNALTNH